jgi:hypothetical protein
VQAISTSSSKAYKGCEIWRRGNKRQTFKGPARSGSIARGKRGRLWEAGWKLDKREEQEPDPERALTCRKGMVLEEREVIG